MNRNKGFTLIELLIVVAIIAILAAIAVAQYQAYQQRQYSGGSGSQTGSYTPQTQPSYLVCLDGTGKEVSRIPAIPGQAWYFEGGAYVTNDANGNPSTVSPKAGESCQIRVGT